MDIVSNKVFPISASRINAMECLFYFWSMYLDPERRETETQFLPLIMGKFNHLVIERYNKGLLKQGQQSDFSLFQDIFSTAWQEQKDLPESSFESIEEALLRFAERHTISPDTVLQAEYKVGLNWELKEVDWLSGEIWLRAILDLVEVEGNEAIITDYKTGYYIPPENEVAKSMQTKIYPFALWCLNNYIERFTVKYEYIRWGKRQVFEIPLNNIRETEERLKKLTTRIMKKIENPKTEWKAIRCELCGICPFECPLIKENIEVIKTVEQATRLAQQVEAFEQQKKRLEAQLKLYTKQSNELIETHDNIWGWKPLERVTEMTFEGILELCLKYGIPPERVFVPEKEEVFAVEHIGFIEDVKKLVKISVSSAFGKNKKKDEGKKE